MDLSSMGEKIKTARTDKKLTLEALSEKLGISRNFLWEIEAGRKAPAIQTLNNIAKELNISIDYLFGLSKNKKLLDKDKEENLISKINLTINELNTSEIKILYELIKTYQENK